MYSVRSERVIESTTEQISHLNYVEYFLEDNELTIHREIRGSSAEDKET
jgi:hypothetical protein